MADAPAPSVFAAREYRAFLKEWVRFADRRGYQGELARAAGCQVSYLSQVLSGRAELTPDHALALCRFLRFGEAETEYFLCLVQHSRAATPLLRRHLENRLHQLRGQNAEVSRRVKSRETAPDEVAALYYSSWHWAAIHVLISVPGFSDVKAIATRLRLPPRTVEATLNGLARLGLARHDGDHWESTQKDLHLGGDSAFTGMNHSHWRQKSAARLAEGETDGLHYTGVHSLSRQDAERIREILLEAIARSRSLVGPSPPEELACLLCDFFLL